MTRFRALACLLFLAALVAAPLSGCSRDKEAPSAEAELAHTDESQMNTPGTSVEITGEVGINKGQSPPPFTLPDLQGNQVSLSDFAGDVVILDLWATWCPPCRKEIPFLVSLYQQYKDQGLSIVGVALDRDGPSAVAPFVEANKMTYTVLIGNQAVSQQYKVTGIPMTLMIDRTGRVAYKEVGFATEMEGTMRQALEELLAAPVPQA